MKEAGAFEPTPEEEQLAGRPNKTRGSWEDDVCVLQNERGIGLFDVKWLRFDF